MARSNRLMRVADRVGGVAALRVLALGRHRRNLPENPQRIGVIIPTAIGDTILASGVIQALADKYGHAEILVYHSANNGAAVGLLPVPTTQVLCDFANPASAIQKMRRAKLDMVVDLTPWTRITAICARFAAPVAIGFDPPTQHRASAFDIAVPHCADVHELDNHAAMAALFSHRPYRMSVRTERFVEVDGLALDRLVLAHPAAGGARAADKAWPVDRWVGLTHRLVAAGWQVAFTGTRADTLLVETILERAALPTANAISLCGKVPLGQLGDLLRRSRLLITIDTGILHLAAAVGANILALHGPTLSRRWGAQVDHATSLDSCHPAAGYIRYGYETHHRGSETMLAHELADVAVTALGKLTYRSGEVPFLPRFDPVAPQVVLSPDIDLDGGSQWDRYDG